MLLLLRFIFIFSLLCTFTYAQHARKNVVESVAEPFRSFKYTKVIAIADSILLQDSVLTQPDLMEINRMKAVSHFAIGEEIFAKNCFNEILKNDPKFKLDPVQNSPKIINFFNQIKLDYLQSQITLKDQTPIKQNTNSSETTFALYPQKSMKSAMVKSVILPGWGHLYMDRKKSGIPLLLGSLVMLPPMVYYIFDTNKKEKDYLNETSYDEISKKYNSYNKSYKTRNGFIAGYALIWLYSQWDLFSSGSKEQVMKIQPGISKDNAGQLIWTAQFSHYF